LGKSPPAIVRSKRVSSGISELDKILGGGYYEDSLILVCGNPGTGKTIFSTQFLFEGTKHHDERRMHVSFAEGADNYYRNMAPFGLDMRSLADKGQFKFLDLLSMRHKDMQESLNLVLQTVAEFKPQRLVIDSISAVLQSLGQSEARTVLHALKESSQLITLIGKVIKEQGVTTLLIGEVPYGESRIGFGIEEFIADGVIILRASKIGATERREIEIAKMRGSRIERATYEYLIDERYHGVELVALPTRSPATNVPKEKMRTGIAGLDQMLHGGLLKASVTLVEGNSGVGKTTLSLQFLAANAKNKQKGLYISLEEPVSQAVRLLESYGIDYHKIKGNLLIESLVPEAVTPLHYYKLVREIVERIKPKLIVIDPVTAIQHTLPKEAFIPLMRYFQLLCKQGGLTALLTSTTGTLDFAGESGISTLTDNIIVMRYHEVKGRIEREIAVVKTRMSPHDKRIVPFEITGKGIKVQNRGSRMRAEA
jgi:circadian clock protein KaiC